MIDIPDELGDLLRRSYLADADSNSLLRKLVAAVESYFDEEDVDEEEADEKAVSLEEAAQRGWEQALVAAEKVLKSAICNVTPFRAVGVVEHLEEVLENIEDLFSYEPDPYNDAESAYEPFAKKAKPRLKAGTSIPTRTAEDSKPVKSIGGGGKHQITVLAFLQATDGTATRKATRELLMQAGVGKTGAYGVIARMIVSEKIKDLGDDWIALPVA